MTEQHSHTHVRAHTHTHAHGVEDAAGHRRRLENPGVESPPLTGPWPESLRLRDSPSSSPESQHPG